MFLAAMNHGGMVFQAHNPRYSRVAVSTFPEMPIAVLPSVNYFALARRA
jgi:hypothetical protein